MKRILAACVLSSILGMILIGVVAIVAAAISTPAEAAPCRCPLIYAPVVCDHGRTYPNQCVADCHNAQNCVPTGGL